MQGNVEHFQDSCGGSIGWLNSETYYTAFTEGWALYAENPLIANDTNVYDNELMQKYGMLKWQVGVKDIIRFSSFSRAGVFREYLPTAERTHRILISSKLTLEISALNTTVGKNFQTYVVSKRD